MVVQIGWHHAELVFLISVSFIMFRLIRSNATKVAKEIAKIGNNNAIMVKATLAIFSPVATTGLAVPRVRVELIPLAATVAV